MKRSNNMTRGGSFMPPELRAELENDPEYSRCSLQGLQFGKCAGRVTREHALIYSGKKIQERFAIIPCCAAHHGVDLFQDAPTEAPKEVRVWVALNRATDEELYRYSKLINYHRERDRLNAKYGVWRSPAIPFTVTSKNAGSVFRNARKKVSMSETEREARALARSTGLSVEAARIYLEEAV